MDGIEARLECLKLAIGDKDAWDTDDILKTAGKFADFVAPKVIESAGQRPKGRDEK